MLTLPARYSLIFTGCTGYGAVGRSLTIYDLDTETEVYGGGCGATDEEAVIVTLAGPARDGGADMTFDDAFDVVSDVIQNARRIVHQNICY